MSGVLDGLLDRTVALSFDRTGYRRHARAFHAADLEVDLHGEEHVVTGANAGLGWETARALAARGARVWMVCRNAARGEEALARLRSAGGAGELVVADVSVLGDIDRAAAALPARVDALVHNAGVLLDARDMTPDGLERTFATHVAGPLRLTAALAPRLAAASRVVWVASGGLYSQRLDVAATLDPPEPFDGVVAYARCKRAQVVLGELLAERLPAWVGVMHPGWADTGGVQRSLPTFRAITRAILRTPAEGADTIVWLATARRGESGAFWFDRARAPTHLTRWTRDPEGERERLWRACTTAARIDPESFTPRA